MFTIRTNLDDLQRVVNGLPENFAESEREVERQIRIIGQDVLVLMQQPGLEPTYPINWDSERQRRAFFATNGFGGGIPYKRKGRYEAGWKALPIQAGVEVLNEEGAARWVGGTVTGGDTPASGGPSRIHKSRWPEFHDAAATVLAKWQEDGWAALGQAFVEAFLKDFRK